jgi:hypothetical protein
MENMHQCSSMDEHLPTKEQYAGSTPVTGTTATDLTCRWLCAMLVT